MERNTSDIVWHNAKVTKESRNRLNWHPSFCLWFTGYSDSGKSTLANAIEQNIHQQCNFNYLLDGDNVRHGLNSNPFLPTTEKRTSGALLRWLIYSLIRVLWPSRR